MMKTILGSFAAAALVSGAVYAAPCDDVSACDPCADVCGTKRSNLKVYTDVAALVGNVDGGFGVMKDVGYTIAGGVKATIGVQRGKNAVELGYTGLYNNLSTSFGNHQLASYNALDANFVKTLDRNPNLKVFVGIGYANFTQNFENIPALRLSIANDMVGFHVGGKWGRQFGKRVGLETYGKLGVYANTVTDNHFLIATTGNCQGSFVAAGGINLTYKLTHRLTSYIGYDVTKIEGVERNQSVLHIIRRRADDGVLIQGMTLGMKAAF